MGVVSAGDAKRSPGNGRRAPGDTDALLQVLAQPAVGLFARVRCRRGTRAVRFPPTRSLARRRGSGTPRAPRPAMSGPSRSAISAPPDTRAASPWLGWGTSLAALKVPKPRLMVSVVVALHVVRLQHHQLRPQARHLTCVRGGKLREQFGLRPHAPGPRTCRSTAAPRFDDGQQDRLEVLFDQRALPGPCPSSMSASTRRLHRGIDRTWRPPVPAARRWLVVQAGRDALWPCDVGDLGAQRDGVGLDLGELETHRAPVREPA